MTICSQAQHAVPSAKLHFVVGLLTYLNKCYQHKICRTVSLSNQNVGLMGSAQNSFSLILFLRLIALFRIEPQTP
jgi:hypothetical protein